MNMKHLMMNGKVWIGAFTVFAVLVIVFAIIIPMMRENSVLGHGNPTKQKLMVIDQDTGAISFVTKSLQGINDGFTSEQDRDLTTLKKLLGENMDNFSGFIQSGNKGAFNLLKEDIDNRMAAYEHYLKQILGDDLRGTSAGLRTSAKNHVKHSGNNGILANVIKQVDVVTASLEGQINKKISSGARVDIQTGGLSQGHSHRLGDDQCDGNMDGGSSEKTRWCRTEGMTSQMDIRLIAY